MPSSENGRMYTSSVGNLVSNWSFGYRGYGRESEMLGGQKGAMYI